MTESLSVGGRSSVDEHRGYARCAGAVAYDFRENVHHLPHWKADSKVSDVESELYDPAEARRIAERAEAAPYVDYPPTPGWYAPAGGAWAAAYVALLGLREAHGAWLVVGLVLLVAMLGAFLSWYQRYHGAFPSMRRAPREFRRAFVAYGIGLVVVVVAIAGAWLLIGHAAAAVTAFVVVALGLALYERAYAAAARRTRERLA
jgi:hypothetical protein